MSLLLELYPSSLGISIALARARQRHSAESRMQQLEAESLALALPDGFRADVEKEIPQYSAPHPHILRTLASISGGAVWGVLARRGLMQLTEYDGAYLGGVVWANFAACFVMGMAVNSERTWEKLIDDSRRDVMFASKGVIPFYVGITTGFCGTCSSFSSFILEAFNKAANTLPSSMDYPNAAYGIMEALSVFITHIGISVAGFHGGRHLTDAIDKFPIRKSYLALEYGSSALGLAAYVISIVLACTQDHGTWRLWAFLCIFAPWGAMLRFFLSKKLNSQLKNFPLGTFAANTLGCILLAIFTVLARGKRGESSRIPLVSSLIGCQVLVGLDDGFCGALTTVSTFVVELFGLVLIYDYRYGTVLVLTGFGCMILILGSYNWSVGLTSAVCAS
ncbi:CIC11C00000000477 [Sungouiella intermedia]|uniref:CIC11C00000000477 n=1 Tax=Sungouiella intermedia TaxID=45354 RepID=A0A1L0DD83_9ASCO|nr:CIC11C00000000477 [[Candida] intermedia]